MSDDEWDVWLTRIEKKVAELKAEVERIWGDE